MAWSWRDSPKRRREFFNRKAAQDTRRVLRARKSKSPGPGTHIRDAPKELGGEPTIQVTKKDVGKSVREKIIEERGRGGLVNPNLTEGEQNIFRSSEEQREEGPQAGPEKKVAPDQGAPTGEESFFEFEKFLPGSEQKILNLFPVYRPQQLISGMMASVGVMAGDSTGLLRMIGRGLSRINAPRWVRTPQKIVKGPKVRLKGGGYEQSQIFLQLKGGVISQIASVMRAPLVILGILGTYIYGTTQSFNEEGDGAFLLARKAEAAREEGNMTALMEAVDQLRDLNNASELLDNYKSVLELPDATTTKIQAGLGLAEQELSGALKDAELDAGIDNSTSGLSERERFAILDEEKQKQFEINRLQVKINQIENSIRFQDTPAKQEELRIVKEELAKIQK
jgi:hypothetical protein